MIHHALIAFVGMLLAVYGYLEISHGNTDVGMPADSGGVNYSAFLP